jgi:Glycosyl transferases group 1
MRILWLTVDRSKRVTRHFDDFRNVVKKYADVTELVKDPLGDGGATMGRVSNQLVNGNLSTKNIVLDYLETDWRFDFIFCDAMFAYMNEHFDIVDIPKGILIEDVHGDVVKAQVDRSIELGFDCIFHRYNFAFHKMYPEARFKAKCIWMPHAVDESRFNQTQEKTTEVLHAGAVSDYYYPHRTNVVNKLLGKSYFTYMKRPYDWDRSVEIWPTGDDYAKVISSARICITGGSVFDIPTLKFVEIPAAGSLLMSNWFPGLGLMGFKPGENMLTYIDETIVEDVENALKNDEMSSIVDAGRNLVLSHHTLDIRAKQFVNILGTVVYDKILNPDYGTLSSQVNFHGGIEEEIHETDSLKFEQSSVKNITKVSPKIVKAAKVKPSMKRKKVANGTDWRSRILEAQK